MRGVQSADSYVLAQPGAVLHLERYASNLGKRPSSVDEEVQAIRDHFPGAKVSIWGGVVLIEDEFDVKLEDGEVDSAGFYLF